ncbi:hypothetical protein K474DRAFT_1670548 [Panus rudis PR-1116 ss-1]|nr:hypothetical protein K474DRAFT_1670548 [Panus rudis PR-1116 ss-1]
MPADFPLQAPATSYLQKLFRQTIRITITDGRIFLGTFAGTDKHLNLLLVNTDEFRFTPPHYANPNGRFVGLVMIPRRLIVKIEARQGVLDDSDSGSDGSYGTQPDLGAYT